ncbi:hypothetical protein F511_24332 [Dorcoceras hygrometricum]|uniref:Uncharacterized protein n=1 Tax=Dorcoceras hygrometricum TaxID=472368 RepID=A0A2Z7DAJ4_9LAMI|nr:hypothetical protein F511_24332 [Dorcoceras hygrometricum]
MVYSKPVPSRLDRPKKDKGRPRLRLASAMRSTSFSGREHSDVLSMQMDSDLVIYRTTLVRTFQVAQKKKAAEAVQEALRAQLATDARATKEEALRSELEEASTRAAEEVERMREEVTNAWALGKEEFLKSSEFESLCAKKSVAYFWSGFEGCVAQFRDNGYHEEEHPDPSLMFVARTGRVVHARVGSLPEKVPVGTRFMRSRRRATQGVASAELGLGAELVGLMRSRRRATRGGGQCGTGLKCSSGVATRGGASAELGLSAELRATQEVASAELGFGAQRATQEVASAELGFGAQRATQEVASGVRTRAYARVASAELGFGAQVRFATEEVPVRT